MLLPATRHLFVADFQPAFQRKECERAVSSRQSAGGISLFLPLPAGPTAGQNEGSCAQKGTPERSERGPSLGSRPKEAIERNRPLMIG